MTIKQRMLFIALAPPGMQPTAMTHNMPVNRTLGAVMRLMLKLPNAYDADWGELEDYVLQDYYNQNLDPDLLVCQVPFPGCVIAVSRNITVEIDGELRKGDEVAVSAIAKWISNTMFIQRNNQDEPISRRYSRYLQTGAWQFEPMQVTNMDVGITYHSDDSELGKRLVELLSEQGLECSVRVANRDGSCSFNGDHPSPAEEGRALIIMISQTTQKDSWLAYDVGSAWAIGRPVVPILLGEWDTEPPNILAPYQRLYWDDGQEKIINELVELLGPEPDSLSDLFAKDKSPAPG